MKMKLKTVQAVLLIFFGGLFAQSVLSAEVSYCPNSYSQISMDGHTVMRIWGVPGIASNHALTADPDYGWPTEASIVTWYDAVLSAKADGTCVMLYYDANSKTDGDGNTVHDLWSVAR